MNLLNIFNKGREIYLFTRDDNGTLSCTTDNTFYPFYYEYDEGGKYKGYDGTPLKQVITSSPYDVKEQASLGAFGSDIAYKNFTKLYLTHRVEKIDKTSFKYCFVDIEIQTKDLPDTSKANCPITCISIYNSFSKEIKTWWTKNFKTEKVMLKDFTDYLFAEGFDIILGWNVQFDYSYLHNRINNFPKLISPIRQERYGDKNVRYPAGVSVLDYMTLFRKVYMREASYALNNIAQKHLNEEDWGETDFSEVTNDIKEKNINDILRLVKLEEKYHILEYFDEIRRLTKCEWEDLYHNSRIVEMLLFEEAKNQNIILPNKKDNLDDETFEGATREAIKTGALFNVGKYDLSSAYPQAIVNFCLDSSNITEEPDETTLEINGVFFKQNDKALLPTIVKRILTLKDNLKLEVKQNPDDKNLKTKYDAIKAIVNSCFGVFGNQYFRLYDQRITSTITFLVREVLMYSRETIERLGYPVVYWDTDSTFIQFTNDANPMNVLNYLNTSIQTWGKEKYNKENIDISFEYEGVFQRLFILTKCRYVGDLIAKKGTVREIKGVEIKRVSSTKFEAKFQEELINRILNNQKQEEIDKWIEIEQQRIKILPLEEISFPCKLNDRVYKGNPIFKRALENTKILYGELKIGVGEVFYYVYVKRLGYDKNNKEIDVLAFKKGQDIVKRQQIDFDKMIERNINTKVDNVYEAMSWKRKDNELISLF
jgi:DNA polymerase, archaea type